MALKEWIHSELKKVFEHQGEHGIIVWYDAGGTLSELVDEIIPEGVRSIKFEGSFLALRFELESKSPDLSDKWLIYVPEKPLQESWLRDFELLGERLEMDFLALLQRRYNFPVTSVLSDLFRNRPENSKLLVQNWEQLIGNRTVTENEIIDALLAVTFELNSWDFQEAVLLFLCEQNWQEKLSERGLWEIWRKRLQEHFGWNDAETPSDERDLKIKVRSTVLLADLLCFNSSIADRFPLVPSDSTKRQALSQLAKRWRDSTTWQAVYCNAAEEVEREYNLRSIPLNEALLKAETFKVIDDLWIQEVKKAVLSDGSNFGERVEGLRRIAETRKDLFWSRCDKKIKNFWEVIELTAKIWVKGQDATKACENLQNVEKFIEHYTNEWWELDFCALKLSALQNSLHSEDINRFVNPAWKVYCNYLDLVNRAFINAVKREGWQPTQWTFWKNFQFNKDKIAIFIIDALRLDLAKYLQECLKDTVKFELIPLKTVLPSITEIGMVALLPNLEKLSVTWERNKLCVKINDTEIKSKTDRVNWFKRFIGKNGKIVDLRELREINLDTVRTLIVLSQEIDEFGTFASDIYPQGMFEMVHMIVQNIKFITEKGFQKIFITTDHGFLYASEGCKPWTVRSPSDALLIKRRFVIGGQSEGCWIIRAEDIKLEGELLFAFPEGFSVFVLSGEIGKFFHGGVSLQECIIPFLKGYAPLVSVKVSVKMKLPEMIASRLLKVEVEAKYNSLYDQPRKVKVLIHKKESDVIELGVDNPKKEITLTWLDAFENPPEFVDVQLLDADTHQVLEKKKIKVKLLI